MKIVHNNVVALSFAIILFGGCFASSGSAVPQPVCPEGIGSERGDNPLRVVQVDQGRAMFLCGHENKDPVVLKTNWENATLIGTFTIWRSGNGPVPQRVFSLGDGDFALRVFPSEYRMDVAWTIPAPKLRPDDPLTLTTFTAVTVKCDSKKCVVSKPYCALSPGIFSPSEEANVDAEAWMKKGIRLFMKEYERRPALLDQVFWNALLGSPRAKRILESLINSGKLDGHPSEQTHEYLNLLKEAKDAGCKQ